MNLEEAIKIIEELVYDDVGITKKEQQAWNLIVKEATRQK